MRHFRGEAFLITIFLIFVFIVPGTASAFDISGPDDISPGSDAQYTVEGISGEVKWSASGNFGSGGGISKDGDLTTGSNACGVVAVTAYVNSTAVIKHVRVGGGVLVDVGTCVTASRPSGCGCWCLSDGSCKSFRSGKYDYYVYMYLATNGSCGCWSSEYTSLDNPLMDCSDRPFAADVEAQCSCNNNTRYVHAWRKSHYVCQSCVNFADNDGDTYSPCGSPADCDDTDMNTYEGAVEVCGDGKDNNCDGNIDEGCNSGPPPPPPIDPSPTCTGPVGDDGACLSAPPVEEKREAPPSECRTASREFPGASLVPAAGARLLDVEDVLMDILVH